MGSDLLQSRAAVSTHTDIILDSIADGVFTVDADMRITFFNKAAEKITGISKEKAVGQYCFEVLRSNICEKTCSLKSSLKTGKQTVEKRVTILNAKGKEIPISISTSVLRDEKNYFIGGVESFRDLSVLEELEREIYKKYSYKDIVSKHHIILAIFDTLPIIAESDSTVLIEGPSGSGKELFARAVHSLSPRANGPFIPVNCGALPDTLLESELFGYVKGAFTDAKKDKPGRFSLAKGGSIFLDEIDSLPLTTQVKLLRVLQEKEFEPLGSTQPVKADVRIIAATKEKLVELIGKGTFRDDLFYRLNVVKIELPPLMKRREDIPLLVNHFIEKFNKQMSKNIQASSEEVMDRLMNYNYPGNVRELENIIEHSCVMCRGNLIGLEHLPPEIKCESVKETLSAANQVLTPLEESEKKLLFRILEKNHWNKITTAKELGLHRSTLWRKIKKYGLK